MVLFDTHYSVLFHARHRHLVLNTIGCLSTERQSSLGICRRRAVTQAVLQGVHVQQGTTVRQQVAFYTILHKNRSFWGGYKSADVVYCYIQTEG